MDILSRQRRSKVGISPQFRFAIQFRNWNEENEQTKTVEVLARTKKKALNYFRKHYPFSVSIVRVYSPKERKRYAPNIQETFAREEAKRITDEVFGSTNAS